MLSVFALGLMVGQLPQLVGSPQTYVSLRPDVVRALQTAVATESNAAILVLSSDVRGQALSELNLLDLYFARPGTRVNTLCNGGPREQLGQPRISHEGGVTNVTYQVVTSAGPLLRRATLTGGVIACPPAGLGMGAVFHRLITPGLVPLSTWETSAGVFFETTSPASTIGPIASGARPDLAQSGGTTWLGFTSAGVVNVTPATLTPTPAPLVGGVGYMTLIGSSQLERPSVAVLDATLSTIRVLFADAGSYLQSDGGQFSLVTADGSFDPEPPIAALGHPLRQPVIVLANSTVATTQGGSAVAPGIGRGLTSFVGVSGPQLMGLFELDGGALATAGISETSGLTLTQPSPPLNASAMLLRSPSAVWSQGSWLVSVEEFSTQTSQNNALTLLDFSGQMPNTLSSGPAPGLSQPRLAALPDGGAIIGTRDVSATLSFRALPNRSPVTGPAAITLSAARDQPWSMLAGDDLLVVWTTKSANSLVSVRHDSNPLWNVTNAAASMELGRTGAVRFANEVVLVGRASNSTMRALTLSAMGPSVPMNAQSAVLSTPPAIAVRTTSSTRTALAVWAEGTRLAWLEFQTASQVAASPLTQLSPTAITAVAATDWRGIWLLAWWETASGLKLMGINPGGSKTNVVNVVSPAMGEEIVELGLEKGSTGEVLLWWTTFSGRPVGSRLYLQRLADTDAGVPDAGVPDAGVPDSGVPDAGAPDAGAPDAGVPDAGVPDAGLLDAGSLDGGLLDAGVFDAGLTLPDGGGDAGLSPDAGSPPVITFTPVCGCGQLAPQSVSMLFGLLLALSRRRRRLRPS